jgi:hypothetical protein
LTNAEEEHQPKKDPNRKRKSNQTTSSLWNEDDFKTLKKNLMVLEKENLQNVVEESAQRKKLLRLDLAHRRAQIKATKSQALSSKAQAHFYNVAANAIEMTGSTEPIQMVLETTTGLEGVSFYKTAIDKK